MRATISPYNPSASAKMRISIIPTKIFSCCPSALTPASPAIPIANPAAYIRKSLQEKKDRSTIQKPSAKSPGNRYIQ